MNSRRAAGFSLVELLVALAVLAILLAQSWRTAEDAAARQRLEGALRRLDLGMERARAQAQRQGSPCGLSLGASGWRPPSSGGLPACERGLLTWAETGSGDSRPVRLRHNLPATLRFTANGLVLDGGTVVLAAAGTPWRRCLVMALPLGVVRLGRYGGDPEAALDASACLPEALL